MNELETLRDQCAALKQQLDSQQIVSKELIRKIMRRKASWINNFVIFESISMPLITLFVFALAMSTGVSPWYAVAFLLLGGIDTILDWRTLHIPARMFSTTSVVELKKKLIRQKKERFIQMCVSSPLAFIWMGLFAYNIMLANPITQDDSFENAIMTGGKIGFFVGVVTAIIVIVVLYRKMQSTNDQLLKDLRDLECV